MTWLRIIAVAVVLLACVSGSAASGVRLVYQPSEPTCPPLEDLVGALAANLGYDPVRADGALTAIIALRREGPRLWADVMVAGVDGDAAGQRQMESATGDCAELVGAVALTLSVALEPLTHRPETFARTPVPLRAPLVTDEVDVAAANHVHLGAQLTGGVGLTPAWSPAIAAQAELRLGVSRWRLGAELLASLPAEIAILGGTVRGQLVAFAGRGCMMAGELSSCVIGRGGALWSTAVGLVGSRSAVTPHLSTGLRVGWEPALAAAWGGQVFVEGGANLVHTRLVAGAHRLWQVSPFFGQAGVAAAWELW